MKKANLKSALKVLLLVLLTGFAFISLAVAEELVEQAKVPSVVQEANDGTRIVITTSGPVKFTSYWLDSPTRLIVEFQTKNVASKIGSELLVNEGVIKRITSEYYGGGQNKALKSLTFELLGKAPYKIWQEGNNIILDIQASLGQPLLSNGGKEVFVKDEPKEKIVKRLEVMEAALKQVSATQMPVEATELFAETYPPEEKTALPFIFWIMALPMGRQTIALWLIGLTSILSIGLLAWLFWRKYRLILDKKVALQEIEKLESQVAEKNKLLEQEETIRKTIESTSLQREKEFDQLKAELEKETHLLEQEEKVHKTMEEELSQKEKEVVEAKGSLESLKEVLVEKGIAKKLTTPEKEGELWIAEKSAEKRQFPRLDLSKDYNRTIILRIDGSATLTINPERSRRIESRDKSKSIKSFANNISSGGLCFESRTEFEEKELINLRLFFFGEKVPMMRIKAKVTWARDDSPVNQYGISFISLEEKDHAELNRYIESKIVK